MKKKSALFTRLPKMLKKKYHEPQADMQHTLCSVISVTSMLLRKWKTNGTIQIPDPIRSEP